MIRRLYLETLLISLAVILLEVSYTRVFSFKLVYYFTYLIIGFSLFGLRSGGFCVALFRGLPGMPSSRLIPACCVAASGAVFGGYLVVAKTPLNAFDLINALRARAIRPALSEGAKLALVCTSVFTPFFSAGLALATIFATQTERINRLYFADLLGAGIGCAVCIPLIAAISPPGCVMAAGFVFAAAGLRLALAEARPLAVAGGVLALVLALSAALAARLPDPVADQVKTMSPAKHSQADVLFSRWSPVFRIDVVRFGADDSTLLLAHDGMWGSVIKRLDGDPTTLTHYDADERSLPFRVLEPAPTVLIIGAAGGNEIVAALHFGAAHVTGVELNPVTYSLLTTHFADFSGHLAENPRVTLLNAEGRSFLKASRQRYDLIWFVAPDSYAAMNAATSGAFVLPESYLYTAEMIVDSHEHLTPNGVVCAQFGEVDFEHKPNRTARYVATAREAFRRLGTEDFERHVLLGTSPGFFFNSSTILLKRTPFSVAEVARFLDGTARVKGSIARHAGTQRDGDTPVERAIGLGTDQLARWVHAYPFTIGPVTAVSPFFWHFVRFRDVARGLFATGVGNPEEGLGERLLLLLLGVATVFAAVFLLAPLLAVRGVWSAIPHKGAAAVYFAALGSGFMFLEVSLIQRLTLFLGYPTYSLTVTLFALLLTTGFGSLASERYAVRRNRALIRLAAALAVLVLFYERGLTPLLAAGVGWPLAWRVAAALLLLAPLGLCLGAFMPIGLRTVAAVTAHGEEFVAWSWAVNGFFSVVSSVAATILSMTIGFDLVMLSALAVYLVGIAALARIPAPAAG